MNRSWDEYKGDSLASAVFDESDRTRMVTSDRKQMIAKCLCVYGEAGPWSLGGGWSRRTPRLAYNAIGNATDAIVNDMCQQVIEPQLDMVTGGWEARRAARHATNAIAAFAQRDRFDTNTWPPFLRNGVTCGAGFLRPMIDGNRPGWNRIHPLHVDVDDRSCIDVDPRTWSIRRSVNKRWLAAKFPHRLKQILAASSPADDDWTVVQGEENVVVIEMWRTARHKDPGKYVCAIKGGLLDEDEYDLPQWPVLSWRPMAADMGWWPEPPIYRAIPIQLELNKLLKRTQDSMHIHARPLIFLPRQGHIVKAHIVNDVGAMVEVDGQWQPQQYVPQSMPADAYAQMRTYIGDIFAVLGVNEMAAQSSLPQGVRLDSSLAIQKFADQGSKRFITWHRGSSEVRGQVGEAYIEMAAQIAEGDESFEVITKRFGQPVRVPWGELALDIENLHARVAPVNALGSSVSARLNTLFEIAKVGLIDERTFLQASKLAELERIRELETAPRELLEEIMEEMLITGRFIPPRPYWDLGYGIGLAARYATLAEALKTPEDKVQPVRDWIAAATEMLQRGEAPAPPPVIPTTAAGAAMGAGGMPVPGLEAPIMKMQLPKPPLPAPPV